MSVLQDFITQFSALAYQNPLAKSIIATRTLLSQYFMLDSTDSALFQKLLAQLDAPLKIAVIGQFSSGKSTFLNALLEQEILPSGIIPLTSKVCEISYGENLHLEIFYKDGTHTFAPLEFLEQVQPTINTQVSHYKLYAPVPLLQEVTFLDTPGFNSQNQEDTDITNTILQEVDGIIWVSLIDNVGKNSEREILNTHIRHYRAKSLCVLNQKDRLKNATELHTSLCYAQKAFSGIFENIIAISAKNALKAKSQKQSQITNDEKETLYIESGFNEVLEFIHTHLMPQKTQNKAHKTLYILRGLMLKYYRRLHIPQIHLNNLATSLESYDTLETNQELIKQSQQLFSALDSRLLTLTQQLFGALERTKLSFSKARKNAIGLKTTQEYEKDVYILPLDSVLNTLQRQDNPLTSQWHTLFGAIKHFGIEFLDTLPSFATILQEWENRALHTHQRHTPLFLPYVSSLPSHLQEWFLHFHEIPLAFQTTIDILKTSLQGQTQALAQLLEKTLKNAIKLVCLEIDSKIKQGIQNHQKDSDTFPLYEPNMENIRDMLNNAIGFEYYQDRLFLHNNIAKALIRDTQSALKSVSEQHIQTLQTIKTLNTQILTQLKDHIQKLQSSYTI